MNRVVINVRGLCKDFVLQHKKRSSVFERVFKRSAGSELLSAVKDVSFKIRAGESWAIIGPNGSGKSTLLKLIAGILEPSAGRVQTWGKIVSFLELGVGFHPDLTARENVFLYGSIMGLSEHKIQSKLKEILEFAELKKFSDTKLKNFSSGMKVRLAFATAIQTDPDILLIDEVLAVGDMRFQQKCFDVFEEFRKQGKTIILVTHDLNAARRFCKNTIFIKDGQVLKKGSTQKIIEEYVYNSSKVEEVPEEKKEEIEDKEDAPCHIGNKKALISNVKFLNKFGDESNTFITGDTLIVRLFYQAKDLIKNPAFGVQFYKDDNYVFGVNTQMSNYNIKELKDKGFIDFKIKSLPFGEGKYNMTCTIRSKGFEIYDRHVKLHSFHVKNNTNTEGLLSTDSIWGMSK